MADSRPPTEDELEPVEEPPVTELEREERRLERLRLVTSQWPVPAGERLLAEGEVVHFPVGPDGAHGFRNDSDQAACFVVAGIRVSPEVAEYPDVNKITAQARTGSLTGERLWLIHDVERT